MSLYGETVTLFQYFIENVPKNPFNIKKGNSDHVT